MLVRALPHMTDVPVSLVGGAVRDALLGISDHEDVDLVVEGDALALAERLGHELNVRVVSHGRFGTAYLELPHDRWIDLVMARRERYARPGALPEVEPGTLADDLARRDFTINAMAYRLTGPDAGVLVDAHGGRADIDRRMVRVIRDGSFIEDPSRMIRAARYAARLGFVLDPATAAAARAAAETVDPSSARVGEELKRLLAEPTAPGGLALLRDLGVPWVAAPPDLANRFDGIDRALARDGAPRLDAWALRLGLAVDPAALPRVAVDGWARGLASETSDGPDLARRLRGAQRPSHVDAVMRAAKPAAAVVACALGRDEVPAWWAGARDLRIAISGEDLVAAGVRPGPVIGRALAAVRAAVLDGEVEGIDAQMALAMRIAGEAS
jgi:tRNA nucleotidyltransferase (CCA-adding enzyme)